MTFEEYDRAFYTVGHMQYLARIACEVGVLTQSEKETLWDFSYKLCSWLQSLPPPERGGEEEKN